MTFEAYKEKVLDEKERQPRWRLGQTAFNVLYELRPDLSEQIRGGGLDPFHMDSRLSDFFTWVESNWEGREVPK